MIIEKCWLKKWILKRKRDGNVFCLADVSVPGMQLAWLFPSPFPFLFRLFLGPFPWFQQQFLQPVRLSLSLVSSPFWVSLSFPLPASVVLVLIRRCSNCSLYSKFQYIYSVSPPLCYYTSTKLQI